MDALKLTYADIGKSMEEVEGFLQSSKADHKDIMRTTLAAEEILLTYMDAFGEDALLLISRSRCSMLIWLRNTARVIMS